MAPNQSTTIETSFTMHEGMGGKHNFAVDLRSNDPSRSQQTLTILSNWVK